MACTAVRVTSLLALLALVLAPALVGCSGQTQEIPEYQPSTVVSKAAGSTVLTTPDPISKVAAFYLDFINREGWQMVSRSQTEHSATFVTKKAGRGATIAISPGIGTPTAISISTYPSF